LASSSLLLLSLLSLLLLLLPSSPAPWFLVRAENFGSDGCCDNYLIR
jgi:hypothetical protein